MRNQEQTKTLANMAESAVFIVLGYVGRSSSNLHLAVGLTQVQFPLTEMTAAFVKYH